MGGKTIGQTMNHGFAGSFARTPDMIIATRVAEDTINFGVALIKGTTGNQVKPADSTVTATNFVGIAGKEVKSAYDYANQGVGSYQTKEAVSVFQRGAINVVCANGDVSCGDAVYIAKTTSAFTGAVVGDIFGGTPSGTSGTDYVQLTNAQWGGAKDANNVAELVLLTRANA